MTTKAKSRKKYFTVAEANAMLPYLRSVLRDVTQLAENLRERHERLTRLQDPPKGTVVGQAHREELEEAVESFERDQEKMQEFEKELKNLNVELKDYFTGLVDFPCWMDERAVYLCWKLGEPEVTHWHELEAGFAGRKKLKST